ncbi:MAG: 2-amino-4-hydroxy-6-hydroxymethyldihydropteridine diphosphokinase [Chloroflexi bacterium]|nr:2-amino-4-hydroxy-6-hydroxymethyldihydropteridine diphosphokinase [Chloroflexota bacterium]
MASLTAYLGLGSNLGDRRANLDRAAQLLTSDDSNQIRLLRASSTYETAPWGYAGQPDFLNCVLEIETSSSPEGLLERVKALEREMGRVTGQRFGPRIIDLDILLYGDRTVDQPDLQIPHTVAAIGMRRANHRAKI